MERDKGGGEIKITIICPVRGGTPKLVYAHVQNLERLGHEVYFPPRDTKQDDPTGVSICQAMLQAIKEADRIDIWYDNESQGVHFDFGICFALGKPHQLIGSSSEDQIGKSYYKVIEYLEASR